MRLCKGTTEGPRRVRQLDGAFLFGHEQNRRLAGDVSTWRIPGEDGMLFRRFGSF